MASIKPATFLKFAAQSESETLRTNLLDQQQRLLDKLHTPKAQRSLKRLSDLLLASPHLLPANSLLPRELTLLPDFLALWIRLTVSSPAQLDQYLSYYDLRYKDSSLKSPAQINRFKLVYLIAFDEILASLFIWITSSHSKLSIPPYLLEAKTLEEALHAKALIKALKYFAKLPSKPST